MHGGFGHWLTSDFPVGRTLLPVSCPAGLCLDPGTHSLYSPEALTSLSFTLQGRLWALKREGLPLSSWARPRPTFSCIRAVTSRLSVTASIAPNPLPGLLRKPGHTCTGTLSGGLCHSLTRHLGEMFMGRILISAVTKRSGTNTGGIGWCTDFRQRHLAEGCGCISPGPRLCGSGGGGVLRATRSEAAKPGWAGCGQGGFMGRDRAVSQGALCSEGPRVLLTALLSLS